MTYITRLEQPKSAITVGNKAYHLAFLDAKGFRIPFSYICRADAHREYLRSGSGAGKILTSSVRLSVDLSRAYAIRSSANVEDRGEHSFAGQFDSYLDIAGEAEIIEAIEAVWNSTRAPRVQSYLDRFKLNASDIRMSVLIQQMIRPMFSGVAFSKNPLTGLDETVVEAVVGSGEALVQHGVTPDRWIYKWGGWVEQAEDSALPLELIEEIVQQAGQIGKEFGLPADLEWVYDGENLYWLQLRELTAIRDINIYSNRISKEVYPGVIKPLVWSVNTPLVNRAWVDVFTELIGENDIDPDSLAKSFYARAYFNMRTIGQIFTSLGMPSETLEILMGIDAGGDDRPSFRPGLGVMRHTPRMLRFALQKLGFHRQIDRWLPELGRQFEALDLPPEQIAAMSAPEILARIDELIALIRRMAYFNIITPLLMYFHNAMLRRRLKRVGVDFEDYDITGGHAELQKYEPNTEMRRLNTLFNSLDEEIRRGMLSEEVDLAAPGPELAEFQADLDKFIAQYGHLSDSGNDFSVAPWRESPNTVLKMIAHAGASDNGSKKVQFEDLQLSGWQQRGLRRANDNARRYQIYREAVSFKYTYGYGLLRNYFLPLGEKLATRGLISGPEDIFYLKLDEVRTAVDGSETAFALPVGVRRNRIQSYQDVSNLPEIIYGDQEPPVQDPEEMASALAGIATSRGYYTGPARVVQGVADFDKLRQGDVLVIPYSDVGWTPLFGKAGAIVAESGGILSHSSIVAREYGLPAIVSVPGACQIEDGTIVSVDGYDGKIVVHQEEKPV